jgi:hypothetical protein
VKHTILIRDQEFIYPEQARMNTEREEAFEEKNEWTSPAKTSKKWKGGHHPVSA